MDLPPCKSEEKWLEGYKKEHDNDKDLIIKIIVILWIILATAILITEIKEPLKTASIIITTISSLGLIIGIKIQ